MLGSARPFRAWTFDPVAFHLELSSAIIVDDIYRADRLRAVAMEVVNRDDAMVTDYLASMRLGQDSPEDWAHLFEETEDHYPQDLWYIVAMAPHLTPVDGIPGVSWRYLEGPLQQAGWRTQTFTLIDGAGLPELMFRYADYRLLAPIARHLRGGMGGWLHLESARKYLHQLEQRPLVALQEGKAADYFEYALRDVKNTLTTAVQRCAALRFVCDL